MLKLVVEKMVPKHYLINKHMKWWLSIYGIGSLLGIVIKTM